MHPENMYPSPLDLLHSFMQAVQDDPRITPVHISLYLALHYHWQLKDFENPVSLFSYDVMPLCKVSGTATYHRVIRELHAYGYIRYVASFNHFLGSLIYFVPIQRVIIRKSML